MTENTKATDIKFQEPKVTETISKEPLVDLADAHYRDAKVYNLNRLFNANGESQKPTLDELNALARSRKQGVDFNPGTHTAREIVKAILNRSGMVESPQKNYLENLFTHAMEDNIDNPPAWQNSQSPFAGS